MQNSQLKTLHGHENAANSVATLPNGQVVSGRLDATLKIWDPAPTFQNPVAPGQVGLWGAGSYRQAQEQVLTNNNNQDQVGPGRRS